MGVKETRWSVNVGLNGLLAAASAYDLCSLHHIQQDVR
jgi:hypothetical protein